MSVYICMHLADCVVCLSRRMYYPIMSPYHWLYSTFYLFIYIFNSLNASECALQQLFYFPDSSTPGSARSWFGQCFYYFLFFKSIHTVDAAPCLYQPISITTSRQQSAQPAASTGWDFMYICSSQPSLLSLPHVVTTWAISAMACSWWAGLLDRDWWEELHANH